MKINLLAPDHDLPIFQGMIKNPFGKTVKKENAYAVYGNDPRLPGWTWYVLKMNQSPERAAKNPLSSAFCLVTSPMTGSSGDMGDTYLNDIGGTLISGTDVRGDRAAMTAAAAKQFGAMFA